MYPIKFTRRSFANAVPLFLAGVAACGLLDTNQPNIVGVHDVRGLRVQQPAAGSPGREQRQRDRCWEQGMAFGATH